MATIGPWNCPPLKKHAQVHIPAPGSLRLASRSLLTERETEATARESPRGGGAASQVWVSLELPALGPLPHQASPQLGPASPLLSPPLSTHLYSARLLRTDSFSCSAAMARRRCSFSCSISRSDRVLMWFSSTYTSWYFPEVKRLSWEGVQGP